MKSNLPTPQNHEARRAFRAPRFRQEDEQYAQRWMLEAIVAFNAFERIDLEYKKASFVAKRAYLESQALSKCHMLSSALGFRLSPVRQIVVLRVFFSQSWS